MATTKRGKSKRGDALEYQELVTAPTRETDWLRLAASAGMTVDEAKRRIAGVDVVGSFIVGDAETVETATVTVMNVGTGTEWDREVLGPWKSITTTSNRLFLGHDPGFAPGDRVVALEVNGEQAASRALPAATRDLRETMACVFDEAQRFALARAWLQSHWPRSGCRVTHLECATDPRRVAVNCSCGAARGFTALELETVLRDASPAYARDLGRRVDVAEAFRVAHSDTTGGNPSHQMVGAHLREEAGGRPVWATLCSCGAMITMTARFVDEHAAAQRCDREVTSSRFQDVADALAHRLRPPTPPTPYGDVDLLRAACVMFLERHPARSLTRRCRTVEIGVRHAAARARRFTCACGFHLDVTDDAALAMAPTTMPTPAGEHAAAAFLEKHGPGPARDCSVVALVRDAATRTCHGQCSCGERGDVEWFEVEAVAAGQRLAVLETACGARRELWTPPVPSRRVRVPMGHRRFELDDFTSENASTFVARDFQRVADERDERGRPLYREVFAAPARGPSRVEVVESLTQEEILAASARLLTRKVAEASAKRALETGGGEGHGAARLTPEEWSAEVRRKVAALPAPGPRVYCQPDDPDCEGDD